MIQITKQILPVLLAICTMSGATLAFAEGAFDKGKWAVMIFGGINKAKPHGVHNEVVYGIRAGHALTERFLVGGSLGHSDFGSGEQTTIDGNIGYHFPLSKKLYFLGPDFIMERISMAFVGGAGYAAFKSLGSNGSFTMNVGLGPAFVINDRLVLRILNRYRWFEDRNRDEVDQEFTMGLVVKLGSP